MSDPRVLVTNNLVVEFDLPSGVHWKWSTGGGAKPEQIRMEFDSGSGLVVAQTLNIVAAAIKDSLKKDGQ